MLLHPGRLDVQQSWAVSEAGMTWLCVDTPCQALHQGRALVRVCLGKPTHLQHPREIPKAPQWPTSTKLAVALRQIPVLTPGHTAGQAGTLSRLGFPICLACIKIGEASCSTSVARKHCWCWVFGCSHQARSVLLLESLDSDLSGCPIYGGYLLRVMVILR